LVLGAFGLGVGWGRCFFCAGFVLCGGEVFFFFFLVRFWFVESPKRRMGDSGPWLPSSSCSLRLFSLTSAECAPNYLPLLGGGLGGFFSSEPEFLLMILDRSRPPFPPFP